MSSIHHWDFVDEDGCLHCNCGIGVIEPTPGSEVVPQQTPIVWLWGCDCEMRGTNHYHETCACGQSYVALTADAMHPNCMAQKAIQQ